MLKGRMDLKLPDKEAFERIISLALQEDIGAGDVTSQLLIPQGKMARMQLNARQPMVVAGGFIAQMVYARLDAHVQVKCHIKEGQHAAQGDTLVSMYGNAQALLTGERVTLNLMQRMCGIATLTSEYVKAVAGTGVTILDTRKTMPGLRVLDKYSVVAGGGMNHRMRLDDMVLIKDNHIAIHGGIGSAVAKARSGTQLPVIVECDTLDQVAEALAAQPERIMLDNMSNEMMREAVKRVAGAVPLEASGGVSLETVRAIAQTGVNFISIGKLTHSAPSLDIGADIILEA